MHVHVAWIRVPKPREERPGGLAEGRLFAVRVGPDQVEKIIALFVRPSTDLRSLRP